MVLIVAALVRCFGGAYLTTFLFTLLYAYIIAQSWDWLHGEAGYVNLGHYIYFGIGAYVFALANVNGVSVVFSFVAAALGTGLAGALLSFPLFGCAATISPSQRWRCCRCSNCWRRTPRRHHPWFGTVSFCRRRPR